MTVTSPPRPVPGDAPQILDLGAERDDELLRAFYEELYLPAFPAPEHRESIDVWVRELWDAPETSASRRYLLIVGNDLKDPARRQLSGGHMFEYYPASRCGLLSYLVVAPDRRKQGLGHILTARGLSMLSGAARADGSPLRGVFAETVDPVKAAPDHAGEAWERLEILGRLGVRILDVPYTAPPLGPGQARARDLLLLFVPLASDTGGSLQRAVVIDFLEELYRALGVDDPKSDRDFQATVRALPGAHASTVEVRRETPGVRLPALAIAFHFVRRRTAPERAQRTERLPLDDTFNSFERDLVSYAYRDAPPFASSALRKPFVTEVVFPPTVEVQSEGRKIRLWAAGQGVEGAGRRRRLRVLQSRTVFIDDIIVDHLVMTNLGLGGPDSTLNEYDAVKLLKLTGAGEFSDVAGGMRFATPDGDEVSLPDWLGRLPRFDDGSSLMVGNLRAATVLITTGDDETWVPVYDIVGRLPTEPDEVAGEFRSLLAGRDAAARTIAHRLTASEGIVCSLLNFGEIDHWELADALEPADGSSEYLLWLQKSNLVCVAKSDRVTSVEACRRDIGMTPYLLAPHAVLLHNQEVLRGAADALRRVGEGQSRKQLDEIRRDVVTFLRKDLLPNIFHYRTERLIFDAGERSRGLRDQAGALERQLTQLDGEITARVHDARTREERVLTVVFGLLSATVIGDLIVQFLSDVPRWHLAVHASVLAVVGLVVLFLVRAAGRQ